MYHNPSVWEFGAAHGGCGTRNLAVPIHTSSLTQKLEKDSAERGGATSCAHCLEELAQSKLAGEQGCVKGSAKESDKEGAWSSGAHSAWIHESLYYSCSFAVSPVTQQRNACEPSSCKHTHNSNESHEESRIKQKWGELQGKTTLPCMEDPSQKAHTSTTLLRMMCSLSDSQSTTTSLSFFFSSSWKSIL